MNNKTRGIEAYESGNAAERICFLCEHYTVMEPMISNYRENLIDEILGQKAKNLCDNDEGLGVRIQVAFCMQTNPTGKVGERRAVVTKAIDQGYLTEEFFEGTDDRNELIYKVTCYHTANTGYKQFVKNLKEMDQKDRRVFLPYIKREKSISEIADELQIDYRSVIKRLARIKKKMEQNITRGEQS